MATKAQLDRLAGRIAALAATLDPDLPIRVTVFAGETEAFAMQRHRELRPEHAGRLVRFHREITERTEVYEAFAAWGATPAEEAEIDVWFRKLLDEIDEKQRGNILSLPTTPEEAEAERRQVEELERARSACAR